MPPRKRSGSDANPREEPEAPSTGRRQRVSLACDACRVARERCDGAKPACGTCVTQSRTCSYTPASKKRGVQTGYLRTIELSLSWLFDQIPESEDALYRLLTKNGGLDGVRILQKKDRAGNRLHKKWTRGRVNKEIGRLLSSCPAPRNDASAEESGTEADAEPISSPSEQPTNPDTVSSIGSSDSPIVPRPRFASNGTQRATNLKLPANWRRLVDIYIAYTHCWFPILDKDALVQSGMSYPLAGVPLQSESSEIPAPFVELWAAISLASFQDSMSSEPSADGTLSPKQMYSIARDMIPCEEKKFELAHLRALLLHSLVLIGQGANLSAWMLVGTATRLALHMRETGELFARSNTPIDSVWPGGARAFAACFVLDTMTSACLGQPTFIKAESQELIASLESLVGASRPELWAPIVGFSSDHVNADESQHISIQPLQTFHQLIRFMLILSTSMDASRHGGGGASRKTPEDLVKCLDPEYAFCNTVVFGSAPPVPSAFLLQAIFLACTIYLVRSYRSSLLSSFMEGVESGVSEFGRCASSPFVVCLLGIVQRCGHLDRMHEAERSKWQSTLDSLKALWTQNSVEQSNYIPSNSHTATTVQHLSPNVVQLSPAAFSSVNYNGSHGIITPAQTDSGYNILRADDSSTRPQTYTYEGHGFPMYPPSRSPGNPNPMVSASSTLPFQPSAGSDQAAVYQPDAVAAAGQAVDYDAMLDELGSIDYPDGLDMDPQFMTNLGFAPGCDLGEIFQGDFGLQ